MQTQFVFVSSLHTRFILLFSFQGLSLIEWPSRLGSLTPTVRLDATFKIEDLNPNDDFESKRRYLTLDAHGGIWEERLKLLVSEGFIDDFIIANNEAPL
jgi:tRNA A37 threonylcarbamoyladenosine biosynthesis protein TsaE